MATKPPRGQGKHPPRPSSVMDGLRVKMLKGDPLRDLPDGDREWLMRSVLKGVRREAVMRLAGMTFDQYEQALIQVRRWYQQRIQAYKAQPKVVRPVKAAPQRSWWPFSRSS